MSILPFNIQKHIFPCTYIEMCILDYYKYYKYRDCV